MSDTLEKIIQANAIATVERLRIQHSHRVPNESQIQMLRRIRQEFLNLAVALEAFVPPSRDKSLMHTKLDEARMWACNALLAEAEIREPLAVNHPSPD